MEVLKEIGLSGYPKIINYECQQKIIEQMEKNICIIKLILEKKKELDFFVKYLFQIETICYLYLLQITM